jgi:hypothetical protein
VNETLGDVILDGLLWLFIEHQNEVFILLVVLLVFLDVVEFCHQFTVPILSILLNSFDHVGYLISFEVILYFFFELSSSLLCLCADHRIAEAMRVLFENTEFF